MKIALTGGGTGGHFYPLIAVAEAIHDIVDEKNLIEPQLYYLGPSAFDPEALIENEITHLESPAASLAQYRGLLSRISGSIKLAFGCIQTSIQLFNLYPDVIFSSGGYAAFPTLFAARLWRVPVVMYDADAAPGKVSLWASKFARAIAVAQPEAPERFSKAVSEKIARTGHPIRKEIETPAKEGGHEFLKLDPARQTIFIMGGSQGAQSINNTVLDALPELITRYNIVHQTGKANVNEVEKLAAVVINRDQREHYRAFGLLNTLALRMVSGITNVVIARAGSGTIFEVACWGIPAILVPLPIDVSHDQTENAFSYARAGGAIVLEQKNLTPHLLIAEIDRLMADTEKRARMAQAARAYARPHAARTIAQMLVEIALTHTSI